MNEIKMNFNYRNSLKPHLTSSSASKSGNNFGFVGRGGDVIEMAHMYDNYLFYFAFI